MQYMLFLYSDEERFHRLPQEEQERIIGAHMAYTNKLEEAGALMGGNPLANPSEGKSIKAKSGGTTVEDGPFTDSKEQLGGYYLIEAENLDEAIDWASECPVAIDGTVEIRPVWKIS
ncbi:MAG: YciI family protein [Pseudomonadota bacterium]